MGDVAMTVPVIRAFVENHPDTKVTVLTRKFFEPFFRDLPNVSVYNADVKGRHKGLLGLFRLAKELRKRDIDAVADLHNVLRTKVLKVFLKGLPFARIDKGRAEKKRLVSGKEFKQLKSTHQRYADVLEKLGFLMDLSGPTFPAPKQLSSEVQAWLGNKTNYWVGIAPFAQHASKVYPLESLSKVIEGLDERKDVNLLLFGGGEHEMKVLETLERSYGNVVSIAGKCTLNEELDIISNLDVMLSMNSGNAHIAAMLGRKVVTVWGVTHPYAGFYPFDQDGSLALTANRERYPRIPTSVYGNKYPDDHADAIASVPAERILETINSLIQKNPTQKSRAEI